MEGRGKGATIGSVTRPFTKVIVALVAAGVMYAGPVAACVCTDRATDEHRHSAGDYAHHHMASMPCCPDESPDSDPSHDSWSDSGAYRACDPMPADVLPVSLHDVPAPIAMAVAALAWPARGPPNTGGSYLVEPQPASPIYLTTRRLRI